MEKKPVKWDFEIPKQCVDVRITDFTKPCKQLQDGSLLCDGVIVHAKCISPKEGK